VKSAFQVAVRQLGLAPSEFWRMRPRHFWWLVDSLKDKSSKRGLSDEDRRGITEMLNGNGKPGGFW